jgi:sugar lactone lactonase YvrE
MYFNGAYSVVATNGTEPLGGIAADANGNLYLVDPTHKTIIEETLQANGTYASSAIIDSLSDPRTVALDAAGDLYVADAGLHQVLKYTPSTSNGTTTWTSSVFFQGLGSGTLTGVAVGSNNTVYIVDSADKQVYAKTPISGGGYTQSVIGSTNLPGTLSGIAVDANSNVYVTDISGGNVYQISASNQAVTTVASGFKKPYGVTVDASGNVYVTDSGNNQVVKETPSGSGTWSGSTVFTPVLNNEQGIGIAPNGTIYVSDTGNCRVVRLGTNFGSVAVGSTSPVITLDIVNENGSGMSFSALTMGVTGLDFTNVGTGSCSASNTANECTVDVTFTPKYAGARLGAAAQTPLSFVIVYLSGIGVAPQISFLPGTLSAALNKCVPSAVVQYGVVQLSGVAVDGGGNIYASYSEAGVFEPKTSSSCSQNSAFYTYSNGAGYSAPYGELALDGAGALYISTSIGLEYQRDNMYGTLADGSVSDVAVDGSGNVYFAGINKLTYPSPGPTALNEAEGTYNTTYQNSVIASVSDPIALAVDNSGNVFASSSVSEAEMQFKQWTPSGTSYTSSVIGSIFLENGDTISAPGGLAVDGVGNVYGTAYESGVDNSALYEWSPAVANGVTTYSQSTVYNIGESISGLATDGAGNIYLADASDNNVYKYDIADAPSLSFLGGVNQTSPAQAVTIKNNGTAPLNFSSITYPTYFPESSSATGDCAVGTPVAVSSSCTLTITFAPTAWGSQTGSLVLTDNTLNASSAQQTIALTGTAVVDTPTISVASGTYNTTQTVTLYDAMQGASFYYTIDGSLPTTASTPYTGAITVSTSETITAVAVLSGHANSNPATATYNLQVALPTFSLASGSYTTTQEVTLSEITPGATIYYTIDNSTPSVSSTKYTGPITVSSNESISAIAYATGFNTISGYYSTATYTFPTAPTPAFSEASGIYATAQTITITDSASNATIYYTIDDSTPTISSTKYTGPITVTATNENIIAIAVIGCCTYSNEIMAGYEIDPNVAATVTFSPAPGTYTTAQTVTLSSTTSGATIYYETPYYNGKNGGRTYVKYTGPISLSSSFTAIVAYAVASGDTIGTDVSANYTINPNATPVTATPAFSVATGTYTSAQTVTLSDTTSGATIYYTTNGSMPTTSSTKYTSAITVSAYETINAIAYATGYSSSAVSSASYTINLPTPLATFSLATASLLNSGTYSLNNPTGIAVDGSGNLYIADSLNKRIIEVTANNNASVFSSPYNLADPQGLAVNGNLYIADSLSDDIVGAMANGSSSLLDTGNLTYTLSYPYGVALDGSGNLYIADSLNNHVLEVTAAGVESVQSTGSFTLDSPYGVAVDGSGNLYIADTGNNRVVEVTTAGNASVLSIGSYMLSSPYGVTVDSSGDLYIADTGNDRIVVVTTTGAASVLNTGSYTLNNPSALAVDLSGNAYISDSSNNRVVKLAQGTPAPLTFASTNVGSTNSQTVTLTNLGTATLNLSGLSISGADASSFTLGSGTSNCTASTTLSVGTSCAIAVNFTPLAAESLTATLTVTDNSQNIASNTQTIALGGTATQGSQTIVFTDSLPGTAIAAPGLTYTLSASGGASGNPVTFSVASGPGSISGANSNLLTFTGLGTVTVAANQAGNAKYTAASQLTQSITITALTPKVTVTPATFTTTTQQNLSVTVTVSGGTGNPTPTGSLMLSGGGYTSTATQLTGGSATINIPVGALTTGSETISAIYTPDAASFFYGAAEGTSSAVTVFAAAILTSPAPGSTLTASPVTFQWTTGAGATEYAVSVGNTSKGSYNLYRSPTLRNQTSVSVSLPINDENLYVSLCSFINSTWQCNYYNYSTSGTPVLAALTSPTPGSTLTSSSATFQWSAGSGVSGYILALSATNPGSHDLYSGTSTTATSASVTGLPTNGLPIYARLYSHINGSWAHYNDYVLNPEVPATLALPTQGTALAATGQVFTWAPVTGATGYTLYLGTSAGGGNLLDAHTTNTTVTTGSLPINGETIYARLWTNFNGVWKYTDSTFTAAAPATLTSPTAGATITAAAGQTFTWAPVSGVTGYTLYLGTSAGGGNLLDAHTTATTVTAGKLPAGTIYARLWTNFNGVWKYNDYSFTAK